MSTKIENLFSMCPFSQQDYEPKKRRRKKNYQIEQKKIDNKNQFDHFNYEFNVKVSKNHFISHIPKQQQQQHKQQTTKDSNKKKKKIDKEDDFLLLFYSIENRNNRRRIIKLY